jgi:transcriptional regulator with XRE-family HTH domain
VPGELRKTLAVSVKELRFRRQETQQDLADAAGYSLKYVQLIEGSTPRSFGLDTIERLALALHVEPIELLDGSLQPTEEQVRLRAARSGSKPAADARSLAKRKRPRPSQ